jgi:hypothetical protein
MLSCFNLPGRIRLAQSIGFLFGEIFVICPGSNDIKKTSLKFGIPPMELGIVPII